MDWKIMAASFVALIVVSSILLGGFGLGDFFSNIIDTIGDFLRGSPFGGIAGESGNGVALNLAVLVSQLSLQTESPVNISTEGASLEMFSGRVYIDYESESVSLVPENTELSISLPLQEILVEDMTLGEMSINGADFEIMGEEGKTAGKGNLTIRGFHGSVTIGIENIFFSGNASSVSVDTGKGVWELSD